MAALPLSVKMLYQVFRTLRGREMRSPKPSGVHQKPGSQTGVLSNIRLTSRDSSQGCIGCAVSIGNNPGAGSFQLRSASRVDLNYLPAVLG
jgi:hypothetical protein